MNHIHTNRNVRKFRIISESGHTDLLLPIPGVYSKFAEKIEATLRTLECQYFFRIAAKWPDLTQIFPRAHCGNPAHTHTTPTT